MKISVIITVYNLEKYIESCLKSIVDQSYQNLEIIVVDDGSTDLSGQICDKYSESDSRIRVIHQENKGMMSAWYEGIKLSTGDYISNVDGDDWIEKETYKELANLVKIYNPDIISFGGYRHFSDTNNKKCSDSLDEGLYDKELIKKNVFPRMIWDSKNCIVGGIDPSRCMKLIRSDIIYQFLNSIDHKKDFFAISYGQDIVTTYPIINNSDSLYITHKSYYYHRQRASGIVPGYITDENFTRKVFYMYEILRTLLPNVPDLIRQLDMLVSRSMDVKENYYYPDNEFGKGQYLFPFGSVRKNSKIILYGAGEVGRSYFYQISKTRFCEIVRWVDKKYDAFDSRVSSPQCIFNTEYDYIVISIASCSAYKSIKQFLIDNGICGERIIWEIY